jgi:hypothetical protein
MNADDADIRSGGSSFWVVAMGLLDKTNPIATWKSVLLSAALAGVSVPGFFLVFGKPWVREEWAITVPLFSLLGAFLGGLVEWQIDDSSEID